MFILALVLLEKLQINIEIYSFDYKQTFTNESNFGFKQPIRSWYAVKLIHTDTHIYVCVCFDLLDQQIKTYSSSV